MRRVTAVVALLGGLSVVGACSGGTARPISIRPASARPPAGLQAQPTATGPTTGAQNAYIRERAQAARTAWVSVPVATLWNQPGFARSLDQPVEQSQPAVSHWLSSMNLAQKLELDNIMATQALMDEQVTVIETSGRWADVLVQDQTGSVYPDGVEGWLPLSQLTFTAPPATTEFVTVSQPLASAGGVQLSYGTRLPVVSRTPDGYTVTTPAGQRTLSSSDVRPAPPAISSLAVLHEAEKFLGLPYLWAGTSAYGFDCSGLTYAVYKQFGIQLARDAGDQARQGRAVAKDQLRPGDLMFFAWGGVVDHVGFYAGNGMMLHAPETGSKVQLIPIWSSSLARNFAGARRYFG